MSASRKEWFAQRLHLDLDADVFVGWPEPYEYPQEPNATVYKVAEPEVNYGDAPSSNDTPQKK